MQTGGRRRQAALLRAGDTPEQVVHSGPFRVLDFEFGERLPKP
jgi:hypothetical protein